MARIQSKYLFIETRSDKDELCGVGKKISKMNL